MPEIPFESVPNFLKLPPDLYLGEASGVAVNSKKHIFVFSRGNTTGPAYGATAAQILEFGPDGKYIREIGHNLYAWSFAHAIRFDKDDNLWAVDKGSDMIIKFNPEGRVVMVFGRKKEASDEGAEPWKRVTAAASRRRRPIPAAHRRHLGPAGQHLHQRRLHQFARRQVRQERRLGEAMGRRPAASQAQFNTPHSIASDAKGNIYVADRGNRRIQVFDPDGKFLREITHRRAGSARGPHVDGQSARAPTPATVGAAPPTARCRRRAVGHLHHARARRNISTAPTLIRDAFTS